MALPFTPQAPLLVDETLVAETVWVSQPVSINWEDVNVSIRSGAYWGNTAMSFNGNERQALLHNAYGSAKAGEITAVLGPEAGGKSLLLKVLAGRLATIKYPEIRGEISLEVGGLRIKQQHVSMTKLAGYVQKTDFHFAWATVHETLSFTAKMRLHGLSQKDQSAKVDEILDLLGIEHSKNKKIGSDLPVHSDLNAAERKLATLGCELLHSPALLFLDEPTHSMDSCQALTVIETLKKLSSKGYTVVTALRQPRADLFDRLVLMTNGQTAYSGPAGDAAADFFTKMGAPLPSGHVRADHYISHITLDTRSPQHLEKSKARMKTLVAQCRRMHEANSGKTELPFSNDVNEVLAVPEMTQVPTLVAFRILLGRQFREIARDKWTQKMKILIAFAWGCAFGVLFWREQPIQPSMKKRATLLMLLALMHNMFSTIHVSQNMPRQVMVVNRDRAHKLYGVGSFYVAYLCASFPFEIIPVTLNGTMVYFLCNLRIRDDNESPVDLKYFFIYLGILFVDNLVGAAFGSMLASLAKQKEVNPAAAPLSILFSFVFGGWYITVITIPSVMKWVGDISWVRWAFEALIINELADRPMDDFSGTMYKHAFLGGIPEKYYPYEITDQCFTNIGFEYCPYALSGNSFLKNVGLHANTLGAVMLFLVAEWLVFHALAIWILVLKRPSFVRCRDPPSDTDRRAVEQQQAQDEAMAVGLFANAMNAQPVIAQEVSNTVPAS